MEILNRNTSSAPVRAIIFDFDGTLSTLRCGWENVMRPLMLECIGMGTVTPELESEVDAYINESTGIQTIFQMKWLANRVVSAGGPEKDPWEYKAEYNKRLMDKISAERDALEAGTMPRDLKLMLGSEAFLQALTARGVKLFAASGTDDADVRREATALGMAEYFTEIAGAPAGVESCSKEAVLRRLLNESGYSGESLAVIGDGKVEIALGKASGARALGIASNEEVRCGINEVKRQRLIQAGADAIIGDFSELNAILSWLGLN